MKYQLDPRAILLLACLFGVVFVIFNWEVALVVVCLVELAAYFLT